MVQAPRSHEQPPTPIEEARSQRPEPRGQKPSEAKDAAQVINPTGELARKQPMLIRSCVDEVARSGYERYQGLRRLTCLCRSITPYVKEPFASVAQLPHPFIPSNQPSNK
jgi:hypothetical protein